MPKKDHEVVTVSNVRDVETGPFTGTMLMLCSRLLTGCKYVPRRAEVKETEDLVVDDEDQIGDDDERTVRIGNKPVRTLSHFAFFDPGNELEMLSLSVLEDDDSDTEDRKVEGAGVVAPLLLNEEDGGQMEDAVDVRKQQYIRLTAVIRHTIDYAKKDE